jgi:uncharacterized protein
MLRLAFGGHEFQCVGGAALFWPAQSALIVADLHLEKASWYAAGGQMLPPYDSHATLTRVGALMRATGATTIWCLGDNFHDNAGTGRLGGDALALLASLTRTYDWRWIVGNHDPALASEIGGSIQAQAEVAGLVMRHHADPRELRPELTGHFHPKYQARAKSRAVSRPCFVMGARKLILPAFGALTGGLSARHPEIIGAAGAGAVALVPTRTRLLRFALTQ